MVGNNPQNSAKVLLHMPECIAVNATLNISADKQLLQQIKEGYENDSWCKRLPAATASWPELHLNDGLWYVGSRLTIPHTKSLCKTLFQLVHDVLSHFRFDKTYRSLRTSYYWPNMHRDLKNGYVP